MAVIVKDEGVTLGQLALGVTQFKVDREVYAAGVANDIGAPGAFDPFAIMTIFNLRVDGEVATIKHWDVRETPRVELIVEVEYAQNCVWIELWTYLYVIDLHPLDACPHLLGGGVDSERSEPEGIVHGGRLSLLDSERSQTLALDIRGYVPLYEEFLELLTSEEAIAHLEDVGPEMIRQLGRSLAQWELSH